MWTEEFGQGNSRMGEKGRGKRGFRKWSREWGNRKEWRHLIHARRRPNTSVITNVNLQTENLQELSSECLWYKSENHDTEKYFFGTLLVCAMRQKLEGLCWWSLSESVNTWHYSSGRCASGMRLKAKQEDLAKPRWRQWWGKGGHWPPQER